MSLQAEMRASTNTNGHVVYYVRVQGQPQVNEQNPSRLMYFRLSKFGAWLKSLNQSPLSVEYEGAMVSLVSTRTPGHWGRDPSFAACAKIVLQL